MFGGDLPHLIDDLPFVLEEKRLSAAIGPVHNQIIVTAHDAQEKKTVVPSRGKILQFAGKRLGRGSAKCLKRFGGPDRDRTDDLFHAIVPTLGFSITYKTPVAT
jgi:hypothetical protein